MSDVLRITGISTGWDTDSLVEQLMSVENLKVDAMDRERTYVEWEQEAYREVSNELRTFSDNYFDVLNSDTNFRSAASFAKFDYSVTSNGSSSSAVSVSANATITDYSHTINSITQLATKDSWLGNAANLRGIRTDGFDFTTFQSDIAASGDDFEISVAIGANTETLTISAADIAAMSDSSDLVSRLNTEVTAEFGSDYDGLVSLEGSELKFDSVGNVVKLLEIDTNTESMDALGLTTGVSSMDYTSKSLSDLYGLTDDDLDTISINGTSGFDIEASDSITEMINKINGASAGVKLSFDVLTDQFQLESTSEGSANNIEITDGSEAETLFQNLFGVADLVDASGSVVNITREEGQNALLNLDGVDIVQSTNTFSISGVSYTLNEISTEAIDIEVDKNTDDIIENIVAFVDDYNTMIEDINARLDEEKDYDYDPLTDDEKDALTDDEIETLEAAAKSGILRNANELESMLTRMRQALYESVDNVDISLSDIGIESSSNYSDHGKLIIDEDTLRSSLETNYDDIVKLFTNESDKNYYDTDDSAERYSENGVGNRLYDITQDYIRTTRDENGYKGLLIEKAGVEGDISLYSNYLTSELNDIDDEIDDLLDLMDEKEENYYLDFASMETALAALQEQSSALYSMMG